MEPSIPLSAGGLSSPASVIRERPYLNTLNVSMANQIIGFEPEAMATTTPYISTSHVSALLEKEQEHIAPQRYGSDGANGGTGSQHSGGFCIDTGHPLDEINRQIIQQVLTECRGNQSAAAKRLGVSRTTLWRMLKQ